MKSIPPTIKLPPKNLLPPMAAPCFSLVIPAYNESTLLPRLLDSVEIAQHQFRERGGSVEVIVADNCSTDATATLAAKRGCSVISVEQKCIGAVRNAGARTATGRFLAFVDADATIHPQTFIHLATLLEDESIIGGATGVNLERWSVGLVLTYAFHYPFLVLTKMDTGLVFCRRADFESFGGYDESLRFAEDVAFLLSLRRLGKRRKQRLTRATSVKGTASTRKFDEYGDWHYFKHIWRVGSSMIFKRSDIEEIVDRYWYKPNR